MGYWVMERQGNYWLGGLGRPLQGCNISAQIWGTRRAGDAKIWGNSNSTARAATTVLEVSPSLWRCSAVTILGGGLQSRLAIQLSIHVFFQLSQAASQWKYSVAHTIAHSPETAAPWVLLGLGCAVGASGARMGMICSFLMGWKGILLSELKFLPSSSLGPSNLYLPHM